MPFQKGNKAAVGSKGGRRKSAYQEQADASLLFSMFFDKLKEKKVLKMIEKGEYSLKDKFVEMAFKGNERILSEIFKKLFPDKYEGELTKPVHIIITRGEDASRGGGEEDGPISESDNSLAQKDIEGMEQIPKQDIGGGEEGAENNL